MGVRMGVRGPCYVWGLVAGMRRGVTPALPLWASPSDVAGQRNGLRNSTSLSCYGEKHRGSLSGGGGGGGALQKGAMWLSAGGCVP